MAKSTHPATPAPIANLKAIGRRGLRKLAYLRCWLSHRGPDRDWAVAGFWQQRGEEQRAIVMYRHLALGTTAQAAPACQALVTIYTNRQDWRSALDFRLLALDFDLDLQAAAEQTKATAQQIEAISTAIASVRERYTGRDTGDASAWNGPFTALALSLFAAGDRDAAFNALACAIEQQPDKEWDKIVYPLFQVLQENRRDPDFPWSSRLLQLARQLCDRQPERLKRRLVYAEIAWSIGRCGLARELYGRAAQQQLANLRSTDFLDTASSSQTLVTVEPSFAIVGAMKSGSTSLYAYLQQHPQVLPLARKEVDYWSWRYSRGRDWFLSHIPQVPASWQSIAGDASPTYLQHARAPQRAIAASPNFKAIVVLRNPVDRTISHHFHNNRRASDLRDLDTAIAGQIATIESGNYDPQRLDNAVASSLYAPHVARWLEHFDRERFLVILSDELFADPQRVLSRVFAFLEIADCQIPDIAPRHIGDYDREQRAVRDRLQEFFAPSIRDLETLCDLKTPWR